VKLTPKALTGAAGVVVSVGGFIIEHHLLHGTALGVAQTVTTVAGAIATGFGVYQAPYAPKGASGVAANHPS
jgi:hypothetical protein